MKVKGSQAGWGFWLGWVVASTVGFFVGFWLGFILGLIIIGEDNGINLLRSILGYFMFGTSIGAMTGVLQWLVLRGRVSRVGWWVLASTAGLAVARGGAAAVASGNSEVLGSFEIAVMALGGAMTGILQWLVLRRQVSRAGWWVLASTVGWGLGMTMEGAGLVLLYVWGTPAYLLWVGSGAVLGAVTGGALVWLLRQPVPEA